MTNYYWTCPITHKCSVVDYLKMGCYFECHPLPPVLIPSWSMHCVRTSSLRLLILKPKLKILCSKMGDKNMNRPEKYEENMSVRDRTGMGRFLSKDICCKDHTEHSYGMILCKMIARHVLPVD